MASLLLLQAYNIHYQKKCTSQRFAPVHLLSDHMQSPSSSHTYTAGTSTWLWCHHAVALSVDVGYLVVPRES